MSDTVITVPVSIVFFPVPANIKFLYDDSEKRIYKCIPALFKQELKNCVNKINHYKAKIKNFNDDSWKTKYNNLFLDYIKLKNNL